MKTEFEILELKKQMAQVGRFLASKGWSPATSSNYSHLLSADKILISRSGVDKYNMLDSDYIQIDFHGQVIESAIPNAKSSAETLIHTTIYKNRENTQCVLHTHSPENTRLSLRFEDEEELLFSGYELQKGLGDTKTHEGTLRIPILPNAQNMTDFSKDVEKLLKAEPDIWGFLIAGHGLYTWGRTLAEAKRHIETFEFLFQCRSLELMGV
jgi:methylthioribulose-1-phosphate dehydratase